MQLQEVDNNKCENEKIGSSPHKDWGFLTLVLQSDDSQVFQLFHDN